MNEHEQVNRARAARELLESDLWIEAWEAYRTQMLSSMEYAKTDDVAIEARRMLAAAHAARAHLERIISAGTVAAADLEAASRKPRGWLSGLID